MFYLKDWVKKFQVVQADYDLIKISVVLNYKENIDDIRDIDNKIHLVMGESCNVAWEFLDDIIKTDSGKYLYTKSLVRY